MKFIFIIFFFSLLEKNSNIYFVINNTTNTYEEVHAQLKDSFIVGDKHGNGVVEGDIVKVSHRKELYKIHKVHKVSDGNNGEPYPVFELAPLQPVTIFRGEHQIELYEE